jgi:hypothetical protein
MKRKSVDLPVDLVKLANETREIMDSYPECREKEKIKIFLEGVDKRILLM